MNQFAPSHYKQTTETLEYQEKANKSGGRGIKFDGRTGDNTDVD